jgi:hypothetical protein
MIVKGKNYFLTFLYFSFDMDINPNQIKDQNLMKSPEEKSQISQVSSSYMLENIHEKYYVPNQLNNNQTDADFSPMNPTNLHDRMSKFQKSNLQNSL